MNLKNIFITGYIILIGAIIINFIWSLFGLNTWYGVINNFSEVGFSAFVAEGFNLIFLFVIYPLALGALALLEERVN